MWAVTDNLLNLEKQVKDCARIFVFKMYVSNNSIFLKCIIIEVEEEEAFL